MSSRKERIAHKTSKSQRRFASSIPVHEMYEIALAFNYDPKLTRSFVRKVLKLRDTQGQETTVSTLKNLKTDLLMSHGHSDYVYQTKWVAKTPSGNFKGVIGRMFRDANTSPKMFNKVKNLLQIYTCFIEKGVTPKQVSKFFDAVDGTKKVNGSLVERKPVPYKYHNMIQKAAKRCQYIERKRFTNDVGPLPMVGRPMPLDSKPIFSSMYMKTQAHQDMFMNQVLDFERSIVGHKLMRQPWFKHLWNDGPCFSEIFSSKEVGVCRTGSVGEIRVSQEPGCKARFYLDGDYWVQRTLQPLKKALMNMLFKLPWDGTHFQTIADPYIIQRQSRGQNIYCFDLSNATDIIPRELQETMLNTWFPDNPLLAFYNFVNAAPARLCLEGVDKDYVTWKRGQALGLGPSFASFALWHGLTLFALNGYTWSGEFFIVGDDVVILDDNLASAYQTMLDELDLDWSPNKTLISDKISEFTGRVVLDKNIFQGYKWRRLSETNLLDKVACFGPSVLKRKRIIPANQRSAVQLILSQPAPFGAGWNPNGLSADARLLYHNDKEAHKVDYHVVRRDYMFSKKTGSIREKYQFSPLNHDVELLTEAKEYVLNPLHHVKELVQSPLLRQRGSWYVGESQKRLSNRKLLERLHNEHLSNVQYVYQATGIEPHLSEDTYISGLDLDLPIRPNYAKDELVAKKAEKDRKLTSENINKLVKEVNYMLSNNINDIRETHSNLVKQTRGVDLTTLTSEHLGQVRSDVLLLTTKSSLAVASAVSSNQKAEALWYLKKAEHLHKRVQNALDKLNIKRA